MARIKFNPIVRAVAVIASVAALATGTTFALLQSNTVHLNPNTLAAATASLEIGAGNGGSCADSDVTDVPGFTDVVLTPGVASAPVLFCLNNTGDVAMDITAKVPVVTPAGGEIDMHNVTLTITCVGDQPVSGPLDQFDGTDVVKANLAADTPVDCSATAELPSNFTGSGNVPEFSIDFTGTQVAPAV